MTIPETGRVSGICSGICKITDMRPKVYIDGHVGTTGLRIREWLAARNDLDVVMLPDEQRKDPESRRAAVSDCDVAVLCLPDDAAREVAGWAEGTGTRLIDASTAHRVADDWVYGLAELTPGQRDKIRSATRVSNPGCYACAFVLLIRPLVDEGLLRPETPLVFHGVSGYSGGGRSMIERWEAEQTGLVGLPYEAPYAFDRQHKHLPEMTRYSGMQVAPQFLPAVGSFATGMRVQVPLHVASLDGTDASQILDLLSQRYRDDVFVDVGALTNGVSAEMALDPRVCNGTNRIELRVLAHPSGHVNLVATLDNLGKGACGMALQSLNLMLGLPEQTGLPI